MDRLGPVGVEGITDINCSDLLSAHMDLRHALPRILERCGDRRGEQPLAGSVAEAEKRLRGLGVEDGEKEEGEREAERLGREVEEKAKAKGDGRA